MSKLQIILLALLVLGLVALMLATWGSIGSALCAFLLIIVLSALLYRKFVLDRDEDRFEWES